MYYFDCSHGPQVSICRYAVEVARMCIPQVASYRLRRYQSPISLDWGCAIEVDIE